MEHRRVLDQGAEPGEQILAEVVADAQQLGDAVGHGRSQGQLHLQQQRKQPQTPAERTQVAGGRDLVGGPGDQPLQIGHLPEHHAGGLAQVRPVVEQADGVLTSTDRTHLQQRVHHP